MATQKGRNWSSSDIVTAANLKSIERGVSAMAEEYTPTTWANGNTVTAAALNNIEQGIANAGGGSSDFSTAEVTLRNTTEDYIETPLAYLEDDMLHIVFTGIPEDHTITIPLYKGHATIPYSILYSLEGNAEVVGSGLNRYIDITGDCTITISSGGSLPK